jgi:hypothetical protein
VIRRISTYNRRKQENGVYEKQVQDELVLLAPKASVLIDVGVADGNLPIQMRNANIPAEKPAFLSTRFPMAPGEETCLRNVSMNNKTCVESVSISQAFLSIMAGTATNLLQ